METSAISLTTLSRHSVEHLPCSLNSPVTTIKTVAIGLCHCGCGKPAPLATKTRSAVGHIKGQPIRFIQAHVNVKHGKSGTPELIAYQHAKYRCTNPKAEHWKDYGGRGIKFCFVSFEQFIAHIGPRPEGKTLDRINNDGNYETGNVRWATHKEQVDNRRQRVKQSTAERSTHHKKA